ncbi:MAG: pantoate--beta-alanine ligase, partial [Bdellovibrionales bacterium]|nr:pantoate--beta-alanine ligase [Bdellovibrionales bacterium]
LSIYVNPTQFNNESDFNNYPITLEEDLQKAHALGIDVVLLPSYSEIYPDKFRYKVSESDFSFSLCGANRPGHFDGVLTVVLKLLNIVKPLRAYFGEKDFQQLALIKGMVKAFFIPTEVIACPTVRQTDGLALSSRNKRLSEAQLKKSTLINKDLRSAGSSIEAQRKLEEQGFKVDYVVDYQDRRYAAVYVGEVRLIDNVAI